MIEAATQAINEHNEEEYEDEIGSDRSKMSLIFLSFILETVKCTKDSV